MDGTLVVVAATSVDDCKRLEESFGTAKRVDFLVDAVTDAVLTLVDEMAIVRVVGETNKHATDSFNAFVPPPLKPAMLRAPLLEPVAAESDSVPPLLIPLRSKDHGEKVPDDASADEAFLKTKSGKNRSVAQSLD
jgi:hypothetical protein